MSDEQLKKDIFWLLHKREPMAGGQVARAVGADSFTVRRVLTEMMKEGHVALCLDGVRYEPASGGYAPPPEAA